MSRSVQIRQAVQSALQCARDNGYDQSTWSDVEVAEDLVRCDASFEGMDPLVLAGFVAQVRVD